MTKSLPEPVRILLIYFARPKEEWKELFKNDKDNFIRFNHGVKMEFTMASDSIEILTQQIKENDVIYIRGGNDYSILDKFRKIKNINDLFDGKVVAGSSMGAYVLAKYFYSNSNDQIKEGGGLLPIKCFAHYHKDKADKLKELEKYKENLKIYAIPDTEFVVIEE